MALHPKFSEQVAAREGNHILPDFVGIFLFWATVVRLILWWIFYSIGYAPYTREYDLAALNEKREHMQSVSLALAGSFPAAHPRLELLKGQNLDIYLSKDEFQSVPYPDRSEAVAKVGRTWCKQVEHTFLPTIQFRDITTGSVLASYGCLMERPSLSE
jgi:hypothetical protein